MNHFKITKLMLFNAKQNNFDIVMVSFFIACMSKTQQITSIFFIKVTISVPIINIENIKYVMRCAIWYHLYNLKNKNRTT